MKFGLILYYIFFIPIIMAKGVYYVFFGINFLMELGLDFATEIHKEMKEI
jgi:hypothetical protein